MKKYIVFQFHQFYPGGGIGDITGSFDEIDEAKKFINSDPHDYNEIVDRDTWEIILEDIGEEVQ